MNLGRELSSLPISQAYRKALSELGFKYVQDFDSVSISDLAKELKISPQESHQLLKEIRGTKRIASQRGQTVFDLLHEQQHINPIVTLSEDIDNMLGGGVQRGAVTEFCGTPGIGKTQIGMQLAVDVHIPEEFHGCEGHCIYLDTEGSLIGQRLEDMAQSLVNHLQASAPPELKDIADQVTTTSILNTIYTYRIHDFLQQVAIINMLPDLLKEKPEVKCIIIDSITFHLRHGFDDHFLKTRLLNQMAQQLSQVAKTYSCAVVLLNQVTTKINSSGTNQSGVNEGVSQLVPALGESWGHNCAHRVILYWKDGQRWAYLSKSPSQKQAEVPFSITPEGVRGLGTDSLSQLGSSQRTISASQLTQQ